MRKLCDSARTPVQIKHTQKVNGNLNTQWAEKAGVRDFEGSQGIIGSGTMVCSAVCVSVIDLNISISSQGHFIEYD